MDGQGNTRKRDKNRRIVEEYITEVVKSKEEKERFGQDETKRIGKLNIFIISPKLSSQEGDSWCSNSSIDRGNVFILLLCINYVLTR